MKGFWMLVTAAALAAVPATLAQTNGANRMTAADSNFATKAAEGGLAEVQLGNLAKDHASSPDVKAFGERMVTDHTRLNDELKSVAAKDNITLPTAMNSKDQATYDRLSKLNGEAFDRAYMRDMVADHKTDIAEFRHEADHGTNPALKEWAGKSMSVLQEHLSLAESTEGKLKK
jgi:putative membrane protein